MPNWAWEPFYGSRDPDLWTAHPLPEAIPVYNVDGTTNRNGFICEVYEAILEIGTHSEQALEGHLWLSAMAGYVSTTQRSTGKLGRSHCQESLVPPAPPTPKTEVEKEDDFLLEPGDGIFTAYFPDKGEVAHLRVMFSHSQQLAQEEAGPPPSEQSFEDLIPEPYRDFKDVFSKDAFDKLPHTNLGTMASS